MNGTIRVEHGTKSERIHIQRVTPYFELDANKGMIDIKLRQIPTQTPLSHNSYALLLVIKNYLPNMTFDHTQKLFSP
jgi:hypothetical protein